MNTIEVQLVKLKDGRTALKYPVTPGFWNMEGYYLPSPNNDALYKLSAEQLETLLPKSEPWVVEIIFEDE